LAKYNMDARLRWACVHNYNWLHYYVHTVTHYAGQYTIYWSSASKLK